MNRSPAAYASALVGPRISVYRDKHDLRGVHDFSAYRVGADNPIRVRCAGAAPTERASERHMVMSLCYWVLRRLLELIVLRRRREPANEISPGRDSGRPIGRCSPHWRGCCPGNGGPA
jgi:hypothetical protein